MSLTFETDELQKGPYAFVYPSYFGNRITIPEDNPTTNEGVYLGRHLFYEVRLSANNAISCATCHQQERAFTDGKKLSLGVDGQETSRNSMALVNVLWSRKFFWDGRAASLEEQAFFPMTNAHEMGQSLEQSVQKLQAIRYYPVLFKAAFGDAKITHERVLKALAQFERTLISANSKYDRYLQQQATLTEEENRGMQLFNTAPNPDKGIRGANCAHCHGGPKNYLELFHNNGLDNRYADTGIESLTGVAMDHGRFKAPTLRNIALTAPYMHDGRFATLDDVIAHYSEHIQSSEALSAFLQHESNEKGGTALQLTQVEKKELIAFLHTLTDSTFIHNQKFSNPFLKSTNEKK
ncbi:cytochrome-c peroxidase [Pedobacter sp. MW01-1-1]|uniref:cytochrome-c peroxidase n=1 Tax=Pedobacter sp. MW01-1-1 TaxID=3383027 RepID=UPI003FF10D99